MKTTKFLCLDCNHTFFSAIATCNKCFSENVEIAVEEKKTTKSAGKASSASGWVGSTQIENAKTGGFGKVHGHMILPAEYLPLTSQLGLPYNHMILFYGDAGCGKSTIAFKLCSDLILSNNLKKKVLYISSEEHVGKLRQKSHKFCDPRILENLDLLNTTTVQHDLINLNTLNNYDLVIVDSISAFQETDKTVAEYFRQVTLSCNCSVVVIGHVNKEGGHAGRNLLKHIVDTVWECVGQGYVGNMRSVVTGKNREQADSLIFYELTDKGAVLHLDEGDDYLKERMAADGQPGSVLTALMVGKRPLLIDVQAAIADVEGTGLSVNSADVDSRRIKTIFAIAYRFIRRAGIIAVMLRGPEVGIYNGSDIGLPLALSLISSARDTPIPKDVAVIGELDISGRIYTPPQAEERIRRLFRYANKVYGPYLPAFKSQSNYIPVKDIADLIAKLHISEKQEQQGNYQREDL